MKTTNYVKATYNEIIDLQTVNGKCSIIGIHTPTGLGPYTKLKGFFTQFRKYKYVGIDSMVMCPAANLPVDPLGLTGVVGSTDLMDPRDALNPILFHGCHGESMSDVLNSLFAKHSSNSIIDRLANPTVGFESQSADKLDVDFDAAHVLQSVTSAEESYYRFLTDPKWRKFGIQSMLRLRKLHPLTWRVASTTPYLPNDALLEVGNVGTVFENPPLVAGINSAVYNALPNAPDYSADGSSVVPHRMYSQQFTNGVTPLGWLPTTTLTNEVTQTSGDSIVNVKSEFVRLPKLFMGVLVLPPSYNVEQFFRLSIRHTFLFKDFTQSLTPLFDTNNPNQDLGNGAKSYFNWIDYTGNNKVVSVSPIDKGTTLDVLDGKSEVVSDSAM